MKKNSRTIFIPLIIAGILLMLTNSCKTDEPIFNDITFNPSINYGSVSDKDGNVYKTVTLGTQVWMAENLKTTIFNNGDTIQHVVDSTQWNNQATSAYCYYRNNNQYNFSYGCLYNWYAVNTTKLCPSGWHVPTLTEWTILENFLGTSSEDVLIAGGKLKETGIVHWESPNVGATNESGFTALPGGFRFHNGEFNLMGENGWWWSATPYPPAPDIDAWFRALDYSNSLFTVGNIQKQSGMSVRCVKD